MRRIYSIFGHYYRYLSYLSLFVCCLSTQAQAQNFKNTYSVSVFSGFVLPHTEQVKNLKIKNLYGVTASFGFKTDGSQQWHRIFNLPEYGAAFTAIDFRTPVLGQSYGFTGFYKFNFTPPTAALSARLRIDLGIAGHTQAYDKTTNTDNLAIGSTITAMGALSAELNLRISKDKHLGAYAELMHFSNGNTVYPNYGLNLFNYGLAFTYSPEDPPQIIYNQIRYYDPSIRPLISVSTGVSQPETFSDSYYPFFEVCLGAHKRFTQVSALTISLDYNYSTAKIYKSELDHLSHGTPITHGNSIGISAGYELFLGQLSANFALGGYLWGQSASSPILYQRTSLRYNISKLYVEISLKAKKGSQAEQLQYGVGYRF